MTHAYNLVFVFLCGVFAFVCCSVLYVFLIFNLLYCREKLLADIGVDEARFFDINSLRNPFKNAEYYIIPMIIAVASFIIARVVDWSCSTDFCEVCYSCISIIHL
jgi:hypothetical protein